jgi:hypothetical protein
MAVEGTPSLVVASAPLGAGLPFLAAAHHEDNLAKLRHANPGMTDAQLWKVALPSTLLSAGMDKLQAVFLGRFPATESVLARLMPAPAAKLSAVALGTIGQTGQGTVVSLSLPASEQIAKELGMKIKGPDWREVMKAELEALGPNAGVSLIYSNVAAAGAPVARHTNRAELKRALRDRHGLELAGFDSQRAAELLHVSSHWATVEARRENSEAKRAVLEEAAAGSCSLADRLREIPDLMSAR